MIRPSLMREQHAEEASDIAGAELRRLVELLVEDEPLLVERGSPRWSELPSLRGRMGELWAANTALTFDTFFGRLMGGRLPGDRDFEAELVYGRQMASSSVSVADMMHAHRIAYDLVQERAGEIAGEEGFSDTVLLRLLELTNAWVDQGMVVAVAGHRDAELEIIRQTQHDRANLVRRVLSGGVAVSEWEAVAASLGLDAAHDYHAVRARLSPGVETTTIERYLLAAAGDAAGVVALVDGDVCGFVARLPEGQGPIAVGVSGAVTVAELPFAFEQATRALETALATGRRGVHDLRALGLDPALLADRDVGEMLHTRFVEPVEQGSPAKAPAILDTVETYLAQNCRLDVTADTLWMHVNSVRYRLARFEELTDCSLRDTTTMVEVWWALRRRRLMGGLAGMSRL